MRTSFRRCPPYEGEEPYLYLCFAEQDREAVFPLLEHLYSRGCRIWYSLENTADMEELDHRQERMNGAALVVLYLTESIRRGSMKSSLLYYQQKNKPVISIDTDNGDNELSVGLTEAAKHIDGRKGRSAEELEAELIRTEGFTQELIGDPPAQNNWKKRAAAWITAAALLIGGTVWYGYTYLHWFREGQPTESPGISVSPTSEDSMDETEEIPTEEPEPTAEPTPTPIPDEIDFADSSLREAVREKLGGGVIRRKDAEEITELKLKKVPEKPEELERLPKLEKILLPQGEAGGAGGLLETGIRVVLLPDGEAAP